MKIRKSSGHFSAVLPENIDSEGKISGIDGDFSVPPAVNLKTVR